MSTESTATDTLEISVIVPVYNVAPYVEECLHSIHRQSFDKPIEVILIDDCSTDGSAELCQQFIDNDYPGFELLHNEKNQGVSAARNRGLEKMTGRYFMFVDPDDILPRDALANLHAAAERTKASIVKGNNTIFSQRSEKDARYNVSQTSMVRDDAILTTLYKHEKVRGHAGGKLFRSDRLAEYRFPVGVRMVEDLLYCCEVFANADSLLLLNEPVYHYRYRESGATNSKFEDGTYIEWLDTVENSGRFCSSIEQTRAYQTLLVRTITQLARECRKLPLALARRVLSDIESRRDKWNIRFYPLVRQKLGMRAMSHYLKLLLALRQIKRRLRS